MLEKQVDGSDLRFLLWIIGTGLLLLIVFFIDKFRSIRWPTVTGIITNSRIQQEIDTETDIPFYMIKISVNYEYNNHTYNPELQVGQTMKFDEASKKILDWPEDKHITVCCNPKKPQKYILKESFTNNIILFIISLILTGIGTGLIVSEILSA